MIQIVSHWDSSKVLYKSKSATSIREALEEAAYARANLAGAYLARADLAGANLAGAYLAGAYLADADLAGADLADANLAGADLARANLAGAYLADANLAGADLARANLAGAYLAGANLAGANLADADLADAERSGPSEPYERCATAEQYARRAQRYRERHPEVPVIDALDQKILDAIEAGGSLDMSSWHTCDTTHCRAGWAITIAGVAGRELEMKHGPAIAGRMIYLASTGRSPHFFASNERAMEDIRKRAAEQSAPAEVQ